MRLALSKSEAGSGRRLGRELRPRASSAKTVASAAALSPSGDTALHDRHDAHRPPPRDVLFVSNRSEAYGSSDLLAIRAACRRIEDGDGGHGIELLTRPSTSAAILAWLTDSTHISPRSASR